MRHASPPVSAYVEVGPDAVEAFVRDHGSGFDLDAVPDDRAGVRESIIGRMERHGGTARIRRRADGTEVELRLPVGDPDTTAPAAQRRRRSRTPPAAAPAEQRRPLRQSSPLRQQPGRASSGGASSAAARSRLPPASPPDQRTSRRSSLMTDPRSIRIVIVDDHHMFRTGVRSELTSLAGPRGQPPSGSRSSGRPARSSPPPR